MARDVRARRGASSGAFNVVDCMRVRGPLNVPVFEAALNEVIQRHSTLRAIVRPNPSWPSTVRRQAVDAFERSGMFDSGMYEQSVLPRFRLTIPYRQLDTLSMPACMDVLRDIIIEETAVAFEYSARPPLRVQAFRLRDDEHAVILTISHLTVDAISMQILWDDLRNAYEQLIGGARDVQWEPVPQFHDFCHVQRQRQFGKYFDPGLEYWRRQWEEFADAQVACDDLPFARPVAGDLQLGGRMDVIDLDRDVGRSVRRLSRRLRVTPFVVFLSAFAILLRRWLARDRVATWIICANRQHAAASKTLGWMANSHIVGLDVPSVLRGHDVIDQCRRQVLGAITHEEVSLPLLWRRVGRRRDQGQRARIVFDWYKEGPPSDSPSGLHIDRYVVPGRQSSLSTGVSLKVMDTATGFSLLVFYSLGQFTPEAMAHAVRELERVLGDIAERPDRLVDDLGSRVSTC